MNMADMARKVAKQQSAIMENSKPFSLSDKILFELENAYASLVEILYSGTDVGINNSTAIEELYNHYKTNGTLYNIRENIWTDNVKTSIKSDMTILDTVSKIINTMKIIA